MSDFENIIIEEPESTISIKTTEISVSVEEDFIFNSAQDSDGHITINSTEVVVQAYEPGNGGSSLNGAIFIVDVRPKNLTDNISNKVFVDGVLESFMTTTRDVFLDLLVFTGNKKFKPVITLFGSNAVLSDSGTVGVWDGILEVTIPEDIFSISVNHPEGPTWSVNFSVEEVLSVSDAAFIGSYPGAQTELKENDIFNFEVTSSTPFYGVEIMDFGAFKYKSFTVDGVTSFSDFGIIAGRNNFLTQENFKVRVRSESGTWSNWFTSTNTVFLNNAIPSISYEIIYPSGQGAIKNGDTANISLVCLNFDNFYCISSELLISNPDIFESNKTAVMSGSTNYNISSNNITFGAEKVSNGATRTVSVLLKIVNQAASFSISANGRLKSGGNFGTASQNYSVLVTANQPLLSAPSFTAPSGTLSGSFTGSGTSWQTSINIHDDDEKGTFSWGSPSAVGLSGIPAVGSGSYVIGGFIRRTFSISAWPTRSSLFGTKVVDVSKLRCTNLSKGTSGSFNFSYKPTTEDEANKFTIVSDDTWYNCDGGNASSNTTGLMQIELEEIA